jgi:hypothetical protein
MRPHLPNSGIESTLEASFNRICDLAVAAQDIPLKIQAVGVFDTFITVLITDRSFVKDSAKKRRCRGHWCTQMSTCFEPFLWSKQATQLA